MGQQANNGGRRATLDQKKRRAAGRTQNTPEREAIKDAVGIRHGKNVPVPGAHGREGVANRRRGGSGTRGEGSGGGGAVGDAHDAPISVGRSTKPARKRT